MKRWKVVLSIVFIFVLGGIAGAIMGNMVCQRRPHWGETHPRAEVVRKLDKKLHLDAGQRAQVEVIVNDAHNQMREMRRDVQPRIDAIMTDAQNKIRAILRPDQKEEFEKLLASWKEKRRKWQEEENNK